MVRLETYQPLAVPPSIQAPSPNGNENPHRRSAGPAVPGRADNDPIRKSLAKLESLAGNQPGWNSDVLPAAGHHRQYADPDVRRGGDGVLPSWTQ